MPGKWPIAGRYFELRKVLTQVLIVQFYCGLKSFDNLLVILKYF